MTLIKDYAKSRGISEWNAAQLAKFCAVGEAVALKEFRERVKLLFASTEEQERVMIAIHASLEPIIEKLVILGLDYGHLRTSSLKRPGELKDKEVTRSLILEEENETE